MGTGMLIDGVAIWQPWRFSRENRSKRRSLFLAFVLLLVADSPGNACLCTSSALKDDYSYATIIFEGKVVKEDTITATTPMSGAKPFTYNRKKYAVEIKDGGFAVSAKHKALADFKGPDGSIPVLTGTGGGDCGYEFTLGQEYLIFAYAESDNSLGTSVCTKTMPLSLAESLKTEIKKIAAP